MVLLAALLVALSLSMDNLAVTVAAGCAARGRIPVKDELRASVCFMLAHLVMFSLGWGLGIGVGRYVGTFAHWIAFGILVFIGSRMIKESFALRGHEDFPPVFRGRTLVWLALVTSIDAWLAGMGLSFTRVSFVLTSAVMGISVFCTSWAGFYFGVWLGQKFGKRMETLGGAVLIVLGVKLLLEGLGIW